MKGFGRFLLCVLGALCASEIYATQIVYQTPQQLGRQSNVAIRGTVIGSRSYWNENRTRMFTETQVRVEETYKGEAPPVVRVVQLGGVVGDVRVTVAGAITWTQGEEVFVFLESIGDAQFRVSGFCLGKFRIERDSKTGEAFVRRPVLEGVEIVGPQSTAAVDQPARMPLDVFVDWSITK